LQSGRALLCGRGPADGVKAVEVYAAVVDTLTFVRVALLVARAVLEGGRRAAATIDAALPDGNTVVTGLAAVLGIGAGIDAQASTTVRSAQDAFRTIGGAGTAM